MLPPLLQERLDRLAPDQRAAATAPPGPLLCIAPAGSGKTTTLVARIAWLIAGPPRAAPETICTVTFNRRAASELVDRLTAVLEPLGVPPGSIRVRTFHALGLEILRSAGRSVDGIVAREPILRSIVPTADRSALARLDLLVSRRKIEGHSRTTAESDGAFQLQQFETIYRRYEAAVAAIGGLDFDDLVAGAVERLEADDRLREHWRAACRHLLVDETQDVDRAQLRLALALAAPANQVFLVGDDDQSIYGWRLADVRRLLGLGDVLPGLARVDLTTNYRCPGPVVERAVRLIGHNRERFVKTITSRQRAAGRLVLAPDAGTAIDQVRRLLASWPSDGGSRAILARTNRELLPAAAAMIEAGVAFRADRLRLPVESDMVDTVLARVARDDLAGPLPARLARLALQPPADLAHMRDTARGSIDGERVAARAPLTEDHSWGAAQAESSAPTQDEASGPAPDGFTAAAEDESWSPSEVLAALVSWSLLHPEPADLAAGIHDLRIRLLRLRRGTPAITLATAHATKGLEFDHVGVVGLDEHRFPNERAVSEAFEPQRALEEERRLAYVAWTRARRSLTLIYDPEVPSPFLLETFSPDELGLSSPDPRGESRRQRSGARADGRPQP